ncbi:TRAP transporter small permease [Sinorhizobium fredii]|uniref:TRAP transporter small permease n=2 Tax=Rhizobium fredii TaxID=380 RepID=UPI00267D2800
MKSLSKLVELTARAIVWFARQVVIFSGIALMVFMTANVAARYVLAGGGFPFAQELPVLIFPWFILGGIVLAAHSGGHMAVEWIYDKLRDGARSTAFVYADRRTMPNVSSDVCGKPCVPGQFGGSPLVGTRHSSHAQRAFRNSRSRSLGRNRSALAPSYGFSFASADSFSSRCA